MIRLRSLLLLGVLHLTDLPAQVPTVRADPRIELTTIVFRLIGAEEYNQCQLPGYAADIDRYFAPFRDHPALKLAASLRATHGIGFDAVPFLAIALTDPPTLAERVVIGANGEGLSERRWAGPHARQFITALRQFAEESKFAEFFAAHRALYDSTTARMQRFMGSQVEWPWFTAFFGEAPTARFMAVPGMCNGGGNYGPRVLPANGPEERYAILGMSRVDSAGLPVMHPGGLPTVIHEFNHSFVNPVVARHREAFRGAGLQLLADSTVRAMMAARAYGDWETIVNESLVRAAVVRYLRATQGDSAATVELQAQASIGFLWIGALDSALAAYEASRATHRKLEQFVPQLAAVFGAAARDIKATIARLEASRPKIVAFTPTPGATEVDPTDSLITVRFDRPMGRGLSINYGPLGQAAMPKVLGRSWDSTGTVLTLRVGLQPATSYQMLFFGASFRSREGVPLAERLFTFKTR
ncbi:MAG: DUF4932 domain-containing protein [Gemmatimonadetes bacterium]|nr:DUF4932 domain-containing protein [Gemmatimonadota bacterium]